MVGGRWSRGGCLPAPCTTTTSNQTEWPATCYSRGGGSVIHHIDTDSQPQRRLFSCLASSIPLQGLMGYTRGHHIVERRVGEEAGNEQRTNIVSGIFYYIA